MSAIPAGCSFALLAFDDCQVLQVSASHLSLAHGLDAYAQAPIEVPEHWKTWKGTLFSDAVRDANLTIVATAAPNEATSLQRRLTTFLFALMISGVPDYREIHWLSGSTEHGEMTNMGWMNVDTFYRTNGQRRPRITDNVLMSCADLSAGIIRFFTSSEHYRVRLGFNRLISGLRSKEPRRRLHEFVASLDGLMALEPGQSRRRFRERAPTFGTFSAVPDPFATLYDLRSADEHLNPWQPILDPAGSLSQKIRDALTLAWTDAAERLACDVYRRLILNPTLLSDFRDETTTTAFWSQSPTSRTARWGSPLPLTVDQTPFVEALNFH